MKKIKVFLAGLIMLVFMTGMLPLQTKAQGQGSVNLQYFYDNLSPYGSWVSSPRYGNVWVPDVAEGFRPYYSNGRWVFTNDGWMWASDYDWGWAPFHYGRWVYDRQYSWMWVPGYDWAPAWVTWGSYSGYYGWAPMGPGVAFNIGYHPPIDYWVFVSPMYMMEPGEWSNHCYRGSNNRIRFDERTSLTVVNNITVVNNVHNYNGRRFSAGPTREGYEKAVNRKVEAVSLRDNDKPGKVELKGNEARVYRPKVDAADKGTAKPAKVVPIENLKRVNPGKPPQPQHQPKEQVKPP